MRACVRRSQARRLYSSVDLSRGDGGVAKQLLNRPEVRASLEQVGRERVPERVRIDTLERRNMGGRLARPRPQPPADIRGRQTTARL